MLFKYTKDKQGLDLIKTIPKKLGPIPVDAVGFSCCLIKTSLLKSLNKPYFITGVSNTEDIYFCMKARDKYPDLQIVADTSIACGHILSAEIIEPANLINYREYFRKQFKPNEDKNIDRGMPYYVLARKALDATKATA
jgi:hypothetical protein